MDLRLTILTIINILSIVMSLIAIYNSKQTVVSDVHYIEKIMEHIELKKKIQQKIELNYDKAIYDILAELPEGSAKVIKEDIDNTVVIRIKRDVFYNN